MREHAPQSTRLAGAITAAVATLAFGYAMANGMGKYIASALPDPLIYVTLPDTPKSEAPPPDTNTLDSTTETLTLVSPVPPTVKFDVEDPPMTGQPPTETRGEKIAPGIPAIPTPPSIRIAPKMLAAPSPDYPASDARRGNEGLSSLSVCIDASGRVSSASLAGSSGHASLDQAALKWVRDRKFTPAKVDGQPQPICGHSVVYEWRITRR